MYATFDPKNGDIGYSLLDVQLCTIKTLGIPQEYADLVDVFDKEVVYILPNFMLVKHKIDIKDKQPLFRLIYSLSKNELAIL